jgi:GR25 family glycosyltransferase involved in LPS biosynthesis
MIKYCFYLNLERRKDRREHIENELNKSSILKNIFQRFESIDGSEIHPRELPENLLTQNAVEDVLMDTVTAWGLSLTQGGLGVLLTYKKLFEKICQLDDFAITFEDDILLSDDFDEKLKKIINELPKDFDLCYLGYGDMDVKKDLFSENLSKPNGMVICLPGLIISPNGAKKILENLKNVDHQIDTVIYHLHKKMNVFISNEKIVEIKNHLSSDIQGNNNCIKKYKKQNYIIATIAYGDDANTNALKFAKDLKYFGQKILIVTNKLNHFSSLDNVIEVPYVGEKFSYNNKIICFEEGFKIVDAVVYIDSDSRIYYDKFKNTYTNFFINIKPGFHPSWCWGHINREDNRFFTSRDVNGRINGYGELALKLCNELNIDYSHSKHYQEGIIILSKDVGKEKILLDTWKYLAERLDKYENDNGVEKLGVGEGNLLGLSLTKSQITINGPEICDLFGESLKYNFWGIYKDEYIKNYPNRKLVRISDFTTITKKSINVNFKDKLVDLTFEILKDDSGLLTLIFEWNKNNSVEFLDHEFRIDGIVYHFDSNKHNEFNFKDKKNIIIEHTYDWYGERSWKELYRYE